MTGSCKDDCSIAILGATSQIARNLIVSFANSSNHHLYLFARRADDLTNWLGTTGLTGRYPVKDFAEFAKHDFDIVINFIGAGDPARLGVMGNSIFDITSRFDGMVMQYLDSHPDCRYLFLSSGAAYGANFSEPARRDTPAIIRINDLTPHEWYGVAKLDAECRHRAHPELCIFDIRVFNYFSRTQDINARFLITDMLRAIRDDSVLKTSADHIVRDYLHPSDFYRLVVALLAAPPANTAVDCYSCAPVDKPGLLQAMQTNFGLKYEIVETAVSPNATGNKSHYYSQNKRAADFGYQPRLTSLDGVLQESAAILGVHDNA